MTPLAPGLLIASPPLGDPRFDRSVVLLASHDEEGAFGWVINGEKVLSLGELLAQAELRTKSPREFKPAAVQVLRGGPVSTQQVWLLFPEGKTEDEVEHQTKVAPGIVATASRDILEFLAQGHEIKGLRAFAGYAGWGPGQLEAEIQAGAWLPGDVSTELLFETPPHEVWARAYQLQGTSPLAFTTRTIGSA